MTKKKEELEERAPEVGDAVFYVALHPAEAQLELQDWQAVITAVHESTPDRALVDLDVQAPNAPARATAVPFGSKHGEWHW